MKLQATEMKMGSRDGDHSSISKEWKINKYVEDTGYHSPKSSKYSFNSKSINFSCFVFRYNRGAFIMYCHLISNINIAYGWIDVNMTNCKNIVIKH